MALDDIQDVADKADSSAGKTRVPLNSNSVAQLKKQVGVTSNTDVADVVNAAIESYMGNEEEAEKYEEAFREEHAE